MVSADQHHDCEVPVPAPSNTSRASTASDYRDIAAAAMAFAEDIPKQTAQRDAEEAEKFATCWRDEPPDEDVVADISYAAIMRLAKTADICASNELLRQAGCALALARQLDDPTVELAHVALPTPMREPTFAEAQAFACSQGDFVTAAMYFLPELFYFLELLRVGVLAGRAKDVLGMQLLLDAKRKLIVSDLRKLLHDVFPALRFVVVRGGGDVALESRWEALQNDMHLMKQECQLERPSALVEFDADTCDVLQQLIVLATVLAEFDLNHFGVVHHSADLYGVGSVRSLISGLSTKAVCALETVVGLLRTLR